MKTVTVTGGYGFLGSHVTEELERRGHFVMRSPSKEYNLLNFHEVDELLAGRNPDVLVHCAAFVGGIEKNVKHPGRMMHDNLRMGINVIEMMRRHDVGHLVLIGTACSYPEKPLVLPINEGELFYGPPVKETGPYGVAKLALFEMARAYADEFGMKIDLIIPSNLYGPGDNYGEGAHVIPSMVSKFVGAEGVVKLWGTGKATRDFLYVDDAADGIADAVERGGTGLAINLGSGNETPIRDIAQYLSMIVKGSHNWASKRVFAPDSVPYRFEGEDAGWTGSERRVLDISRAEAQFGWRPKMSLIAGLRATVEDYRTNRNL
jgi:nucleoside-diphosphate-sugar epimerase